VVICFPIIVLTHDGSVDIRVRMRILRTVDIICVIRFIKLSCELDSSVGIVTGPQIG
jgi:hypothetical protein